MIMFILAHLIIFLGIRGVIEIEVMRHRHIELGNYLMYQIIITILTIIAGFLLRMYLNPLIIFAMGFVLHGYYTYRVKRRKKHTSENQAKCLYRISVIVIFSVVIYANLATWGSLLFKDAYFHDPDWTFSLPLSFLE